VDGLREKTEQVAAELAEAELALEHVAIARATLIAVLAAGGRVGGPASDGAVPAGSVAGRGPVPV
jgi:hypothetical protein